MEGIKIERSYGKGKYGAVSYYIRPLQECFNRSRKVSGFTHAEIEEKKQKLISKWYAPMVIYYEINGVVIGSNNKENALKEYWRVSELEDIGKIFPINLFNNQTT